MFSFGLSGAYRETVGNLGKQALWGRGTVNVRFLRQERVWQSNAQVNRGSEIAGHGGHGKECGLCSN